MYSRLGSWYAAGAAHFVVHAKAETVALCIFRAGEEYQIQMQRAGERWFHVEKYPPPMVNYGYRVNGGELLLDPYARRVLPDHHAVLQRDSYDWENDAQPHVPWAGTIIYECHVKGMTQLNTVVDPKERGTYAGLASEPVIRHLKNLGVTALELLPVMAKLDDQFLVEKGLANYWGYNTLGFFAPEPSYAGDDPVDEFRNMIKTLHQHGIEVILDVVYNHTAEAGVDGPTLSWRGFDQGYYHLQDFTGCGNSLNLAYPATRQMVIDSLVYWAEEMHVDGFRFDLATTLMRNEHGEVTAEFFNEVVMHPVLKKMKLIAEPWDLGENGYQLGNFPEPMREWNDRYRDTMRRTLRGDAAVSEILRALAPEQPTIHFITCHDGFTLADLMAYSEKQNIANLEDNRDGSNENLSFNSGGRRAMRDALALLYLSRGTPMLLAGDEFARTQLGNNNAYCQDNEISWLDWGKKEDFTLLVATLAQLRNRLEILHVDAVTVTKTFAISDQTVAAVQIANNESRVALLYFFNRTELPVPFVFPPDIAWIEIYSTTMGAFTPGRTLKTQNGYLLEPFSLAIFSAMLQ